MKKVSVIIPVYNVEKYLERCLNSVINQTYSNLEIVLVNDGSTDNSKDICDKYEKQDKRVKLINKPNGGLGSARNKGISESTGEYILFLDSDDYIDLTAIEKMMHYAEEYDIVCCGFDRISEETKKIYSKELIEFPMEEIFIENSIMETAFLNPASWGKLIKKSLIKNMEFSNNKKSIEDILFYLELVPKVKKIKIVKEILWHYMVRENSLIMSINEEKTRLFETELLTIKDKYILNCYDDKIMNYLTLEVFIHNCISIPSRIYNNKDVNIKEYIKHTKKYMDDNFKNWRNFKIEVKDRFIKKSAIYFVRFLYKINLFRIFLILYNFMINKLKIDIKW